MINSFSGQYRFLSNFSPSQVRLHDFVYPTVEHAYQANKTNSLFDHELIRMAGTPGQAKKLGRMIKIRDDWELVKDDIMLYFLRKKFAEPILRDVLLATGSQELVEGNTWGDTYWGVCNGVGQNKLGQLLMRVREESR